MTQGTIVVKVGGATLGAGDFPHGVIRDICALVRGGARVIVVHGGGSEITRWSERVGLTSRFVDGLRYSDPDTASVAAMVLAGRVGKALAAALTAAGCPALSLSGSDGGLLRAERLTGEPDLGLVGRITAVDVAVVDGLRGAGLLPVIAPVAPGPDGTLLNVNADDAAADIAGLVRADLLCLVTDVPGVLVPGSDGPLPRCDASAAHRLIADGVVTGGMVPKVAACLRAVQGGVGQAWIIDGRREGAVAAAVAGDAGAGTVFVGDGLAAVDDGADAVMELDRRFVMPTYARHPVVLERGQGCTVWDTAGRPYLDFLAGISVTNIGHCHPAVVAAITAQAGRIGHTSNLYHTRPQAHLAERLSQIAFPGRVFFCNSGTEATEGALKLARLAAWRRAQGNGGLPATEVLSFDHAFHGRTYGALAVTARTYQRGFGPMLDGFRELPWNSIEAAEAAIGPHTAGVIVEPVQGEGGVRPADPGFLRALRRLCDAHGACLIFDEIQCGLGRTGTWFAFEHYGVIPDVVTLGKSLGAGLPMGAVLARGLWGEQLQRGDHGSTFGGNPIVAAGALAGLDVLEREGLCRNAQEMGERLRQGLVAALAGLGVVREVRGTGLLCGVELTVPGARVVDACRGMGLLINCTAEKVLRLMPPLCVTPAEIDQGVEIIARCLGDLV